MMNELKKMKLLTYQMGDYDNNNHNNNHNNYNLSPLIEYFSLSESDDKKKKYSNNVMCIVTNLFGPDMYEYSLVINGEITLEFVRRMVFNLVRALKFIHSKNLIHNDVKLENVVLTDPDVNITNREVTLIDYGFITKNKSSYDKGRKINGTPAYISPEELSDTGHSTKSDIWSLGILILEIISRLEILGMDMLENMVQIESILGHKFTSIHKDVGNMEKLDIARKRFFHKNNDKNNLDLNMNTIKMDEEYIRNIVKKYMDDDDLVDFISCCLKIEQDRWTSEELYNHIFIKQCVEEVDRTICL
jgi:serine/threonine protein kinase